MPQDRIDPAPAAKQPHGVLQPGPGPSAGSPRAVTTFGVMAAGARLDVRRAGKLLAVVDTNVSRVREAAAVRT